MFFNRYGICLILFSIPRIGIENLLSLMVIDSLLLLDKLSWFGCFLVMIDRLLELSQVESGFAKC